jgi:hypothetical protein
MVGRRLIPYPLPESHQYEAQEGRSASVICRRPPEAYGPGSLGTAGAYCRARDPGERVGASLRGWKGGRRDSGGSGERA